MSTAKPDRPAKYRDYDRLTDEAYVNSTWKQSYFHGGPVRWVPSAAYFHHMNRSVPELIDRSHILVCHNPMDRDHIWGWVAVEHLDHGPVVHYVFVREEHRRRGYAKHMLGEMLPRRLGRITISHWTRDIETLQDRVTLRYHPSLATKPRGASDGRNREVRSSSSPGSVNSA